MASKDVCVNAGGLIVGLSELYGGQRGVLLREAGQTLLKGKSSKAVTDVLERALAWNTMPNPQIADTLKELTGDEPELPEPRQQETPDLPEDPSPVQAKKVAAKKAASSS